VERFITVGPVVIRKIVFSKLQRILPQSKGLVPTVTMAFHEQDKQISWITVTFLAVAIGSDQKEHILLELVHFCG
jgi:hypothetical protein